MSRIEELDDEEIGRTKRRESAYDQYREYFQRVDQAPKNESSDSEATGKLGHRKVHQIRT
ncbi:MAG TPA: hypothetical protein VN457_03265 [Chlamydiales bacterium]|nr:hypothetical protein [Chlamydiales bacterium]